MYVYKESICEIPVIFYYVHTVNGRTALLWAAYHGHADSMRSLLKSPETSPDVSDPDGRTG